MSSPKIILCDCGENVFVLRVGICEKCGKAWASHRVPKHEIDEAVKESKKSAFIV